jgi:hypothetical protein
MLDALVPRRDHMELDPQLPPLSTLTPISTLPNVPPDRPPDPSISLLFPEATRFRALGNPFRGPLSKALQETHKSSLGEALNGLRSPFLFIPDEPLDFNGKSVGADISTENFNAAAITVIGTVERGYHPTRDPTPLSASDWARLSCALIAAIGRGYHRQYATDQDSNLGKVRAAALDPNPLTPDYPTLFHRLAATAEDIAQHVKPGQEGYQDWYSNIKKGFTEKVTKADTAEVDEKWLTWKANEIDRLARHYDLEIAAKARKRGKKYFIAMAFRLGLQCTPMSGTNDATSSPTALAGKKRTASGSAPNLRLATPIRKKPDPPTVTTLDRHTISPASTPQGRTAYPSTDSLIRMRLDPSPSRTPTIPQAILTLSPKAMLNLAVTRPPPSMTALAPPGIDTITVAIQAALGPALQAAMAPYAAKLNVLEKATMLPLVTRPTQHHPPKGTTMPIPTPPT